MGSYRHPWTGCKRFKTVHRNSKATSASNPPSITPADCFQIFKFIVWLTTILPIAFWSADQMSNCHVVQHAFLAYYTLLYYRPQMGTTVTAKTVMYLLMLVIQLVENLYLSAVHTHETNSWPWIIVRIRTLLNAYIKAGTSQLITALMKYRADVMTTPRASSTTSQKVNDSQNTIVSQPWPWKEQKVQNWLMKINVPTNAWCFPAIVKQFNANNIRGNTDNNRHKVILDSGASTHLFSIPFPGQVEDAPKLTIMCANGDSLESHAGGECGDIGRTYFVPGIQTSLLGVGRLCKHKKVGVLFTSQSAYTVHEPENIVNLPQTKIIADIDNENMYIMRPDTFGIPSKNPPTDSHYQKSNNTTVHACNACGHKATLTMEDEMERYDGSPYGRPKISDIQVTYTGQLALLELFCGYGVLSRRVSQAGLPVGPPGDLLFGDDFSKDATIQKYMNIIKTQKPVLLWIAFPCTPWSTWQKVNQRYHKDPGYLERWRDKYRLIIQKVKTLCDLQIALGGKIAIEGPLKSAMWLDRIYMKLAYHCNLRNSHIDQCMLGATCPDTGRPFKKPTRIHHNFPPCIVNLNGYTCRHAPHEHDLLTGYAQCGLPKTKLASRYPAMMCDLITEVLICLCKKFRPSLLPAGGAPPLAHQAWHMQVYNAQMTRRNRQQEWRTVPYKRPAGFARFTRTNDNLEYVKNEVAWLNVAKVTTSRNPARIFHEAAGHPSWATMRAMIKHNLIAPKQNGKPIFTAKDILRAEKEDCHGCRMGKPIRTQFKGRVFTDPFTQPLETFIAHDTYGEVHAKGMHGERWFILFVARRSRYCYVYFLNHKHEIPDRVREFLNDYQRDFGSLPTVLHCDNDAVNVEEHLVTELNEKCIRVQTVAPFCEESNPAERYIRKITTIARCILAQSGLPIGLWPYAVQTAVYLHNRTPSRANRVMPIDRGNDDPEEKNYDDNIEDEDEDETAKANPLHGKSPYEMEHGYPPIMTHIVPWGSRVYVTLHQDGRTGQRKVIEGSKLAPAATSAWFIGYNTTVGGTLTYRVYVPGAANAKNGKVYDRKHITFWKGHNPDLLGDHLWRQQALKSPLSDPQMELPERNPNIHPGCEIRSDSNHGNLLPPGPLQLLEEFKDIAKTIDPKTKKIVHPPVIPKKKKVTFEKICNRHQLLLDNKQRKAIESAAKVDPSMLQASKYPTDPNEHPYIGMYILKQFDDKQGDSVYYTGMVVSIGECNDTGLRLWRVTYADNDREDFYDTELRHQIKVTVHARKKLTKMNTLKANHSTFNLSNTVLTNGVPGTNDNIFVQACHMAATHLPVHALGLLQWKFREQTIPQQNHQMHNATNAQPELQSRYGYLFNTVNFDGQLAHPKQWEVMSEGTWGLPVEINKNNLAAQKHCFMFHVKVHDTLVDQLQETAKILADTVEVPQNVKKAISPNNQYRGKWIAAILKELTQLQMRQTYEIVKRQSLPRGRRPITGKMVLAVKRLPDGTIAKFKARYVAHGFRQSEGFDYYKTFAPVVATTTVRMILAHAMYHDHDLFQLDVAGAFLLSDVDADIWMDPTKVIRDLMNQTKGPNISDDECLRLRKGLYGLKQSAMLWHKDFDKGMKSLGFKCHQTADLCAYSRTTHNGKCIIIVAVHVDDCVISCTKGYNLANQFRDEISKKFELSSYGPLDYLLGVRCETITGPTGKYLSTNQTGDIEALMRRFHKDVLPSKKSPATPLSKSERYTREQMPTTDEQKQAMLKTPFRPLIGSLLFLARNRVDIAASVGILSSFNSNPGPIHFKAGRRILTYLYGTKTLGFCYGANKEHWKAQEYDNCISASVDADFAGALVCGKSRTGYVVTMYGDTVEALTQLQKATTNSTGHAELKALAHLVRKLTYYRDILPLFGEKFDPLHPFLVESDSSAAIALLSREYIKFSMTHMRTDFYQILEAIQNNLIELRHVPGLSNVADILTKCLDKTEHLRHTPRIMNQPRDTNIEQSVGMKGHSAVTDRAYTTVYEPRHIAFLNRVSEINSIIKYRENLTMFASELAAIQNDIRAIRAKPMESRWRANLMSMISQNRQNDNIKMRKLQRRDAHVRATGHAMSAQLAIKEQRHQPFEQLLGTPTWITDAYETPTQQMRSLPVRKAKINQWANSCCDNNGQRHEHPLYPAANSIVWFCEHCRNQSCDQCANAPNFTCDCQVYPPAALEPMY